jgi:mRNA interferase RelE/StbE
MTRYAVEFKPSVERALRKLPVEVQKRIVRAIERLGDDPRSPGVVKLAGGENAWRIRIGAYRVVYEMQDRKLVVLALRIAHRKDVYR